MLSKQQKKLIQGLLSRWDTLETESMDILYQEVPQLGDRNAIRKEEVSAELKKRRRQNNWETANIVKAIRKILETVTSRDEVMGMVRSSQPEKQLDLTNN